MTSRYRFAQPLLLRLLGVVLTGLGLVTVAGVVLAGLIGLPHLVVSVLVVLMVVAVVAAGLTLTRLPPLLQLDDAGYRLRFLRRAGVDRARWRDVEDVVTMTVRGHDCVVMRLRDGRTTTIPATVLDASPSVLIDDLRAHLDAGHGYRRIGRS